MKLIYCFHHYRCLKFRLKIFILVNIISLFFFTNLNAQARVFVRIIINGRDPQTNYQYAYRYAQNLNDYSNACAIFGFIPSELNLANIPICFSMAWGGMKHEFALTDLNGAANIIVSSPEIGPPVFISANGGARGCEDAEKYVRAEYTNSTQEIDPGQLSRAINKGDTLNFNFILFYNGRLITVWEQILQLTHLVSSMNYQAMSDSVGNILGTNTFIGVHYPKSSSLMRGRLWNFFEETREKEADEAFTQNRFDEALQIYSALLANFPESHYAEKDRQRQDSCQAFLRSKSMCDSLMNTGSQISDNSKALRFYRSALATILPTDPCHNEVQRKIESLETAIEYQKEELEYNRMKDADERAIKKFKVDRTVAQEDLFKNPFAFKGECILVTCGVYKFQTPTSAILEGGERFYADFKVPPPKKTTALYLIVRVKGVTTLVNAFGTPVEVPLVDVVHILNLQPEN